MKRTRHTTLSPIELAKKIKELIEKNKALVLKKADERGFYIISRDNYGSLSMLEKEYYTIKGSFERQDNSTIVSYEIMGNVTYKTIRLVLPIMMIPTIFLGAIGGKSSAILSGLLIYLALAGLVIYWTTRQERKLERLGKREFTAILDQLNLAEP